MKNIFLLLKIPVIYFLTLVSFLIIGNGLYFDKTSPYVVMFYLYIFEFLVCPIMMIFQTFIFFKNNRSSHSNFSYVVGAGYCLFFVMCAIKHVLLKNGLMEMFDYYGIPAINFFYLYVLFGIFFIFKVPIELFKRGYLEWPFISIFFAILFDFSLRFYFYDEKHSFYENNSIFFNDNFIKVLVFLFIFLILEFVYRVSRSQK